MYKKIGKKEYNTATAKCIGSIHEGRESLYQKDNGEFFITILDTILRPLKTVHAMEWIRTHCPERANEIIKPKERDDKSIVVSLRLSGLTLARLEAVSEETGKPIGNIIKQILQETGY